MGRKCLHLAFNSFDHSFVQSASVEYFRTARSFLMKHERLHLVKQAIINPDESASWNLLTAVGNAGALNVMKVMMPADDAMEAVSNAVDSDNNPEKLADIFHQLQSAQDAIAACPPGMPSPSFAPLCSCDNDDVAPCHWRQHLTSTGSLCRPLRASMSVTKDCETRETLHSGSPSGMTIESIHQALTIPMFRCHKLTC